MHSLHSLWGDCQACLSRLPVIFWGEKKLFLPPFFCYEKDAASLSFILLFFLSFFKNEGSC
jgi:hypothetical protein